MSETPTDGVPPLNATPLERVVSLITLAFSADPIVRWIFPDPHQFFVRSFARPAFAHEAALCTTDFSGAAIWLPPWAWKMCCEPS